MQDRLYHIGFGRTDLEASGAKIALLSGDPARAEQIARDHFDAHRVLSENRGLHFYVGSIGDKSVISATSGMGAPSLSIVVNELIQVGVTTIIRVGTSGSIQPGIKVADVVISTGALCRQGAANDIAPVEYPAVADPGLTVKMIEVAAEFGIPCHSGITASLDTFYEGQGRTDSANPRLIRALHGMVEEYQQLNVLNMEMEAGMLFKMASVYGFKAGCVCGILAERTQAEAIRTDQKELAVNRAIEVAVETVKRLDWEEMR